MSLYKDTGFRSRGLYTTLMHPMSLCTAVMHPMSLGKILASRRESHDNPVVSLKGVALLTDLYHKSSDGSETEIEDNYIFVF